MKNYQQYIKISLLALLSFGYVSCNFLNIVPDEKAKAEDAFEDKNATERYMYSCYSFMPDLRNGTSSLDLMTADEVVTAFEHEPFANFPKGKYTASSPVISYWNTLFAGIRQCYMMKAGAPKTPGLEPEILKDYLAQADFLIAYYHFLLLRCYGPTILVKSEPLITTPAEDYLPREPFDDCVEFICNKFDEAAENLKETRSDTYYGMATKLVAKCMKAKVLLLAASPLFNGNSEFYSDFQDKTGRLLMPQTVDPNKWVKAKEAYKEAIAMAETGHALYENTSRDLGNTEPSDPIQHRLRHVIIDTDESNKEIIWGETRGEGPYGIQNKSMPFCQGSAWNGVAPTLAMLKRFYTKNGLPFDEDPQVDMTNPWEVVTVTEEQSDFAKPGEKTLKFNLNREPRFYAWIAFQGGYYEVKNAENNGAYSDDASYRALSNAKKGKLVCNFLTGGNCSRAGRNNNYSPTGYLNKKGVSPGNHVSKSLKDAYKYPYPIIRLAELYLGYAEACVETGDLDEAKIYLNKVRKRAGIPTVEESWETIKKVKLNQELLRKIVRQERMIEFYLENQLFWDLRRWKEAEKYFSVKVQGLNIAASSIEQFANITTVDFERKFESPKNYLMPIPIEDVNRNEKVVQNPGY